MNDLVPGTPPRADKATIQKLVKLPHHITNRVNQVRVLRSRAWDKGLVTCEGLTEQAVELVGEHKMGWRVANLDVMIFTADEWRFINERCGRQPC